MIGEDLQKFSGSRVMRTIAIGRVPIRNLPKIKRATLYSESSKLSCEGFGTSPPYPFLAKVVAIYLYYIGCLDNENDSVDPVFPCTLCGETFTLPSSLKNNDRLRHGKKRQRRDPPPQPVNSGLQSGSGVARKRQRCAPTPQPGPSTLQSDADGPRKQRCDSSPQAGPFNLLSAASDPIRRSENKVFPDATIFKDLYFVNKGHNLYIVYQLYFSKEEADQIFDKLEREIEYFLSEMATVFITKDIQCLEKFLLMVIKI
ncbi:hypothetical protein AVEN_111494-1 [Araneus ventricosus]|uniref:C2H2-type domain-containing protein n=1 Tax=Araneus ventricosus TaxID=182803 RepID=A0A4Y2V5L7_ARAVE|nr:hypothetical protein AVEN_111494-1 [Araneus ventricosus]